MKIFGFVFCLVLLAVPMTRAQVVNDGATNILSNVTNSFTGVTVGTNGSFTLLVLSNNCLLTNSGNGIIGRSITARSNEVRLVSPTARWGNGDSLYVGSNGVFNRLIVSNGAFVFAANSSYIGQAPGANSNSATVTGTGTRWQSSTLFIGDNAERNLLVVSNGGRVECSFAEIGRNAGGANNHALITGTGSLLTMPGSVLVGDAGSGNRLSVSNGAAASSDISFIGFFGADNTALITGAGSVWTNASLVVGRSGSNNRLVASNSASVFTTAHGLLGLNTIANLNSAIITDPGTRWLISSNLYVGTNGALSQLIVSNGALLVNLEGVLGFTVSSTGNTALISGAGTIWSNLTNLRIGESGGGNRLTITNGGRVEIRFGSLGTAASASNNLAVVTGPGSHLQSQFGFVVGNFSAGNRLLITNGASLRTSDDSSFLGSMVSASNNEVVVTGPGSSWTNGSSLFVGSRGSGNRLIITNGGGIHNQGGFGVTLGANAESTNNRITIDGGTLRVTSGDLDIRRGTNVFNAGLIDVDLLRLTNTLGRFEFNGGTLITRGARITVNSPFIVGASGPTPAVWDVRAGPNNHFLSDIALYVGNSTPFNQLFVTNGAVLTNANEAVIGVNSGANSNTVTVSGSGSQWSSGPLGVGSEGSANRLLVGNGGNVLTDGPGYIGFDTEASSNIVMVTGAGSAWSSSSTVFVGYFGASSQLVVSNGAVINDNTGEIGARSSSTNNQVLVTGAGSKWNSSNFVYIGTSGRDNRLIIANGGAVHTGGDGYLGGNESASNSLAQVTGAGSTLTNLGELQVGANSRGNQLVVSNGGTVFTFANKYVGYNSGAISNTAIVTDSGSRWLGNDSLYVGSAGSFNRLFVRNGAQVVSGIGTLGGIAGANSNQVLVTDAGSLWTNQLQMNVGEGGIGNRLVISNSATVFGARDGFIGRNAGVNSNSVIVTDPGTHWLLSSNLYVGSNGAFSRLIITNGAWVGNARGTVGDSASGSNNFVIVTGSGSVWSNANDLYVGNFGGGSQLVLSNGGKVVIMGSGSIGNGSGGHSNLAIVTDPGTRWMVLGNLSVGGSSMSNLLVITNGGQVISDNGSGSLGLSPSSRWNRAVVTGPGSLWSNRFDLHVGYSGEGNQLVVSDGGKVHTDSGLFGISTTSSNNVAVVTGAGSIWSNQNSFRVGEFGSGNRLMISDGGRVDSSTSDIGSTASSSNNAVTVTGPGSFFRVENTLVIGDFGGGNRLVVSNGAWLHDDNVTIGNSGANNEAVVTGLGTTWTNRSGIQVGDSSSGNRLVIANGAFVFSRDVRVGFGPTSTNNRVVIDGGTLLVTNSTGIGALDVIRGTNVFNAGLIEVVRLFVTNTLGQFEFNGGTLIASGTDIGNGRLFTIGNGASAATFQLRSGTHSFANNLVIAGNASLIGSGTVSGILTTQPGGTLSPGVSVGAIVLSNSPSLQGTVIMEISKSGATLSNDQIQVTAPLAYGGSLIVSNLGPTALGAGDRFQLFSANSYAGSFSGISLPSLTPGLSWTNKLLMDGSIEVILPPPPTLAVQLSNNLLIVSWPTNAPYFCLETASDLSPPVIWQPITNTITTSGASFLFTLADTSVLAKRFFRLAYPCAPTPVVLALQRTNDLITVSWPSNAFRLETTFDLAPPVSWQTVSNGISDNATLRTFTLTNNPAITNQFFRLILP